MKKVKYFHNLTREEFVQIRETKITWAECAIKYPQPKWCTYPGAVCGAMGCWSLMDFMVKGKSYCKNCDCFRETAVTKLRRS